jgi:hypothetical protein
MSTIAFMPSRFGCSGASADIDCGADLDLLEADLADTTGTLRAGAVPTAGVDCESLFIAPAGRLPNVAVAKVVRIGDGHVREAALPPRRARALRGHGAAPAARRSRARPPAASRCARASGRR